MMTPREWLTFMQGADRRLAEELAVGVRTFGLEVAATARGLIGHELPIWPPLADSTIAEKTRLGYTGRLSATDPLLRTGGMRDSIDSVSEGLTTVVGSADPKALWQEMGTHKASGAIPPRPFLATAMVQSLPRAAEILGNAAVRALSPPGATGGER